MGICKVLAYLIILIMANVFAAYLGRSITFKNRKERRRKYMAREKEDFRENLARLTARYPGREAVNRVEVAKITGLDRRTVSKRFEFTNGLISLVKLARELS